MTNESIHRQVWVNFIKHFRSGTEGSVDVEFYKEPQGTNEIQAYICNLMVEPEYRRKGVATDLMDWAENLARQEGYAEVFLSWDRRESTQFAFDWYIRRGYEEVAFGNFNSLLKKKL